MCCRGTYTCLGSDLGTLDRITAIKIYYDKPKNVAKKIDPVALI